MSRDRLGLDLKVSEVRRCEQGIRCLGCRVFPTHIELTNRSRRHWSHSPGLRIPGVGNSGPLRYKRVLVNGPKRLEPGEPWRQLEQHGGELPDGEPQQQHSDEPHEQQRLPAGPEFRWKSGGCPETPDGTDHFPDWLSFALASKISARGRVVLVGRLDDRFERSPRPFLVPPSILPTQTFTVCHGKRIRANGCRVMPRNSVAGQHALFSVYDRSASMPTAATGRHQRIIHLHKDVGN